MLPPDDPYINYGKCVQKLQATVPSMVERELDHQQCLKLLGQTKNCSLYCEFVGEMNEALQDEEFRQVTKHVETQTR